MNPRTRRAALYAIGAIAMLASANALTHSYAGLYDWASHHSLTGWQAMSWPAEIDVFLAIGELALYVAYLDSWPARHRIWPWATALIGLGVSVAGNIGHIQPGPGHPVILADRLTAATSPVAAFAGLAIGLLVLKMTRRHAHHHTSGLDTSVPQPIRSATKDRLHAVASAGDAVAARSPGAPPGAEGRPALAKDTTAARISPHPAATAGSRHDLLREASLICQAAAANGERISQRALARQLRGHGHRFPNDPCTASPRRSAYLGRRPHDLRPQRSEELKGDVMTGLSPDPGLAQTLGQAFETFDAIRQLARRYEGRSPDLLAAFMSAAVAAANGRDAVLAAGARPAEKAGPPDLANRNPARIHTRWRTRSPRRRPFSPRVRRHRGGGQHDRADGVYVAGRLGHHRISFDSPR